jgi:hypothetical protein
MSLTPEERRRIYEEEKARIEAQEQIAAERASAAKTPPPAPPQPSGNNSFAGCISIAILLVFGYIWINSSSGGGSGDSSSSNSSSSSSSTNYVTELGGDGTLRGAPLERGGTGTIVVLGTTEEAYSQFVHANVAQDKTGMQELMLSGKCYTLPVGKVRAKKIDSNWTGSVKVRILTGNHAGESAWTGMESLGK